MDRYNPSPRTFSNSSWGWRGIVWGFRLIETKIAWKVGNPTQIDTWNVRWVNGERPQRKPINASQETQPCNLTMTRGDMVQDFINDQGEWDYMLLYERMNQESIAKVGAIPLPSRRCVGVSVLDNSAFT
ncbi:hypothetical protein RND81_03G030900 [Saponaria officinalis]|uniref:Uncharacterized protein n=1 Tax=Saponaria officinalis TaxID=3572 RepID=A0AAW1M2X7_SAPOF